MSRQSNVVLYKRSGIAVDAPESELRMNIVSIELALKLREFLADGNADAVREMYAGEGEE